MYPECVRKLIDSLKKLPGVGEKSAERMAFSIMNFSSDSLLDFSQSLIDINEKLKKCPICNNITDRDICYICSDESRNNNTIFVVEKPKDIVLFEKIGNYNGRYHVLGGLISPLEGIGPEDINLSGLIDRVKNSSVEEVIVVLKPSIEGETTTQYIKKILEKYNVKVSRLSYGLPMGTDIEYLDPVMIAKAWDDRKVIS